MKSIFYGILIAAAVAVAVFPERTEANTSYTETITLSSSSAVFATGTYGGRQIAFDCTGEVSYRFCNSNTCTITAGQDATVSNFDAPYDECVQPNTQYVGFIRTGSSSVTCYLYRVSPSTICKGF